MEILALGVIFFALCFVVGVLAVVGVILKLVLWPIQLVFRLLLLPVIGLGLGLALFAVLGVGLVVLLGGALALLFLFVLPLLVVFGLVWLAARLVSRPAV